MQEYIHQHPTLTREKAEDMLYRVLCVLEKTREMTISAETAKEATELAEAILGDDWVAYLAEEIHAE